MINGYIMSKHINEPLKIGIIGAGPCGLTAAKNLLEQGLTQITVWEKNDRLGGNWVYSESNKHSSVYQTTHLISSKHLSQYRDFPMPADYPDYPSHQQLLAYFEAYAAHYQVLPFIQYNTTVEQVVREADARWKVVVRNEHGVQASFYDCLIVANGHHWDPMLPVYPGVFNGEILHSHAYKHAKPFHGKRVLVVGGGNSACDIAVEIARSAPPTAISMRNGQHIFPKFLFGKPTDIAFAKIAWLPNWIKRPVAGGIIRLVQGRYPKYQLKKPGTKPLQTHPTINSEMLYSIRHGNVLPRPGIERLCGDTVMFEDGRQEAFDVIIFATGYKTSFPFFPSDFLDYSCLTQLPLYRKMMHPAWDNLYFVGLFQPQGCIWPLADYQAHWIARILTGELKRPSNLQGKIDKEIKAARRLFTESTRHALEVDFHAFRKTLLKEIQSS